MCAGASLVSSKCYFFVASGAGAAFLVVALFLVAVAFVEA